MSLTHVLRRGGVVLGLLGALAATAAPPHRHGTAQLDMAYDGQQLVIELVTPADNLLGFERAPRSEAEQAAAQAASTQLRDADALFHVDPAADCTLDRSHVLAPVLGLGGEPSADEAHADVRATYTYRCGGAAPAWVKLPLRDAFPRLARIELQVTTPRGRLQAVLRQGANRATLAR